MNYIDEIYEEKDIVKTTYKYSDSPSFELDVYKHPDSLEAPVIIWLHGGGGSKEEGEGFALDKASKGYAVFCANYKPDKGPKDPFGHNDQMMAISNVYAAIRWARSNVEELGIERGCIFVVGISAGGLIAMQAGIGWNNAQADYDVFFTGVDYNRSNPDRKIKISATAGFPGGASDWFMDKISKKDPEHHEYHGDKDPLLSYAQVVKVIGVMNDNGVPSTLMTFKGDDHTIGSHTKEINDDLMPKLSKIALEIKESKDADNPTL